MKYLLTLMCVFGVLTIAAQDYQLNGNLGLGTSPEAKLDVDGDSKLRGDTEVDGELKLNNTTTKEDPDVNVDQLLLKTANGIVQTITADGLQGMVYKRACIIGDPNVPPLDPMWSNLTNAGNLYTCHPLTKVGIGTSTPSRSLDVAGDGLFQGLLSMRKAEITLEGIDVTGSSLFRSPVTLEEETSVLAKMTFDGSSLPNEDHIIEVEASGNWSIPISLNNQGYESFRVQGNGEIRTYRSDDNSSHVLRPDGSHKLIVDESSHPPLEVVDVSEIVDGEVRFQVQLDGSIKSKLKSSATNAFNISNALGTPIFVVEPNGNTYCSKLTVANVGEFPDYVFGPSYELMSLADLKSYIQENDRLPNMPSADEVELTGVDLGEMNRLLVEKVEELTLYILQLNEDIEELKDATSSTPAKALSK